MPRMDRRDFVGAVSLAGLAGLTARDVSADGAQAAEQSSAGIEVGTNVTKRLAAYIVSAKYDALPAGIRKEAQRTLLNWMGCAVGGSRHETVDAAIAALSPFSSATQGTILGRRERMDTLHSALINGISSHVLDFDDTHLRTVIHPAGPVVPALLALAEYRPMTG